MFFKKKKKDEEDISLEEALGEEGKSKSKANSSNSNSSKDDESEVSNNDISSNNTSKDTTSSFKFKDFPVLLSDVERLKAQAEANTDIRKLFDERFNRLNEQIGELRSLLVEREHQISDLDVKATKAADLVLAVQPEQLMTEVKKEDAKIESSKAKIESLTMMMDKFREEMSSIRTEMSKFKGLKETLKLNDEVKIEINSIKKSLAMADKDANQVEDIFIQVQKNYSEFMRFKTMVSETRELVEVTRKEFGSVKTKTEDFVTKKDFELNMLSFNKMSAELDKKMKGIDLLEKKVKKMIDMTDDVKITTVINSMTNKMEVFAVSQESLKNEVKTINALFESNLAELNLVRSKLMFIDGKSIQDAKDLSLKMDEQVKKVESLSGHMLEVSNLLMQRIKSNKQ